MRRLLACAVLGIAIVAPAASADDNSYVVDCVLDNNRLGIPYGGNDINPVETVTCIVLQHA